MQMADFDVVALASRAGIMMYIISCSVGGGYPAYRRLHIQVLPLVDPLVDVTRSSVYLDTVRESATTHRKSCGRRSHSVADSHGNHCFTVCARTWLGVNVSAEVNSQRHIIKRCVRVCVIQNTTFKPFCFDSLLKRSKTLHLSIGVNVILFHCYRE